MRALDWKLPAGTAWEWFVATPGAIVLIIIVGLLFRWFVTRAIGRLVARADQRQVARPARGPRRDPVRRHRTPPAAPGVTSAPARWARCSPASRPASSSRSSW